MSISTAPTGSRPPVQPIRRPDALSARKSEEKSDAKSLEQERASLQNQLLLLKASSDAAATPDVENTLQARLEEVSHQLQSAQPPSAATPSFDRYESSDGAPEPSAGTYHVEAGGDGTPSVVFDAPTEDPEAPSHAADDRRPGTPAEKTVINTDDVDREIRQLKDDRSRLQQELQSAPGDMDKETLLRRQISQLDAELAQKDNDTYRRQHASVLSQ